MLQFLRYKPIWAAFAATLIVGTGSSIAGGAGAYFYTYVLGDMKLMSGVSAIGLIASPVGIVMGPYLANRFGKKKVYLTAVIISTALNLLRLLDVTSMILIYISALIGGVAGGWMVPVNTSIQADNTIYVQYKTGKRAEAAIASLTSFVSKVAQGLGGAIPGYVIAAYGFVTGEFVQPESINTGIIMCVLILPLIFGILGSLIFGTQYTLDQKAVIEMDAKINRNN